MLSHVLIVGVSSNLYCVVYMSYLGISLIQSGSYGVCLLVHTIVIDMMSYVIFLGFIMFLLDVILGHTPELARSSETCRFVQTVLIERMSLVMTFSFISSGLC